MRSHAGPSPPRELSPRMIETADMDHAVAPGRRVVACIGVRLQITLVLVEEPHRNGPFVKSIATSQIGVPSPIPNPGRVQEMWPVPRAAFNLAAVEIRGLGRRLRARSDPLHENEVVEQSSVYSSSWRQSTAPQDLLVRTRVILRAPELPPVAGDNRGLDPGRWAGRQQQRPWRQFCDFIFMDMDRLEALCLSGQKGWLRPFAVAEISFSILTCGPCAAGSTFPPSRLATSCRPQQLPKQGVRAVIAALSSSAARKTAGSSELTRKAEPVQASPSTLVA